MLLAFRISLVLSNKNYYCNNNCEILIKKMKKGYGISQEEAHWPYSLPEQK